MNIPSVVTNEELRKICPEGETICVRVIIRRVMNQRAFTIRGKTRRYLAEYDESVAAHVLNVPMALWMHGVPEGAYRDNVSISHDIMGNRSPSLAPLVYHVVPWDGSAVVAGRKEKVAAPDVFEELEKLLSAMNAPVEVFEGLKLARDGHADALRLFAESVAMASEEPPAEEPPVEATPAEEPPEQPSAEEPPVEATPAEEPPEQPSAEEPPVEATPAEEPPTKAPTPAVKRGRGRPRKTPIPAGDESAATNQTP